MNKLAYSKDEPADLVNVAIEELIHQKYELPIYNTLKDAANDVRKRSYRMIYHNLLNEKRERESTFRGIRRFYKQSMESIERGCKKSDFITFRILVARRDWLMETEHLYRITS